MEHKNGSKTSMATLIKAVAANKQKNVRDHPGVDIHIFVQEERGKEEEKKKTHPVKTYSFSCHSLGSS